MDAMTTAPADQLAATQQANTKLVVITNGKRRAHVHRACASAYPGWTVQARGM